MDAITADMDIRLDDIDQVLKPFTDKLVSLHKEKMTKGIRIYKQNKRVKLENKAIKKVLGLEDEDDDSDSSDE